MKSTVAMLSSPGTPENTTWNLQFAFRQPMYLRVARKYVAGMNVKLLLLPGPPEDASISKESMVEIELGISGLFSVEEDKLAPEVEQDLVKVHAPAILFPYVRSTLTSLLSNAGFGSFILPLLNIQEMAKQAPATLEIKIVD